MRMIVLLMLTCVACAAVLFETTSCPVCDDMSFKCCTLLGQWYCVDDSFKCTPEPEKAACSRTKCPELFKSNKTILCTLNNRRYYYGEGTCNDVKSSFVVPDSWFGDHHLEIGHLVISFYLLSCIVLVMMRNMVPIKHVNIYLHVNNLLFYIAHAYVCISHEHEWRCFWHQIFQVLPMYYNSISMLLDVYYFVVKWRAEVEIAKYSGTGTPVIKDYSQLVWFFSSWPVALCTVTLYLIFLFGITFGIADVSYNEQGSCNSDMNVARIVMTSLFIIILTVLRNIVVHAQALNVYCFYSSNYMRFLTQVMSIFVISPMFIAIYMFTGRVFVPVQILVYIAGSVIQILITIWYPIIWGLLQYNHDPPISDKARALLRSVSIHKMAFNTVMKGTAKEFNTNVAVLWHKLHQLDKIIKSDDPTQTHCSKEVMLTDLQVFIDKTNVMKKIGWRIQDVQELDNLMLTSLLGEIEQIILKNLTRSLQNREFEEDAKLMIDWGTRESVVQL
jgi:hypothetical protein